MKKFLALLLSIMMMLGCVAMAEEAPAGLTKNIVVLFTSDAHAGIDQGWGYAGVAAIRDAMAAKNHVVLVNPGEEAKIVDIEATDASLEDLTGGIVGIRDYGDEMTRMVYNRYGQETGMTTNRLIFKGPNSVEAVQGPFFVCSSRYSSYESLPVELQRKLMAELKYPQRFQKAANSIIAKPFVPKHKSKPYER